MSLGKRALRIGIHCVFELNSSTLSNGSVLKTEQLSFFNYVINFFSFLLFSFSKFARFTDQTPHVFFSLLRKFIEWPKISKLF